MFEIFNLKDKTSYFQSGANVGIYDLGNGKAVLIDSCEHSRIVKGFDKQLQERGLSVDTVINTHCHIDHICGNAFFKEKYGAKLLCTKKEKMFIVYPSLESEFYFSGIDTDKSKNPFFMVESSEPEIITDENLPEGFEIIPLPGHSFQMIGVRTPDNVVFLADSVISKKTWDEHKMPFFRDINESIETLEMIKTLKADLFVPSHDEPTRDITPLAEYNLVKLKELKETVYSCCDEIAFDNLFTRVINKMGITVRTQKYPMYSIMIRNALKALVDDERTGGKMQGDSFIYYRK